MGQIIQKEKFAPSPLGLLINPYYVIRRGLYQSIAAHRGYLTGRLLDFGCGSQPYRPLLHVRAYIGLDIEGGGHPHERQADLYYDGARIPFRDCSFDSILASEVLEHIFHPDQILRELHRVLKPGGHMLVTVPFAWNEHETPYDFARYTSFGLHHLLHKAGFEIVAAGKTSSYVETIFQMWNAYIYQTLPPSPLLRALAVPLLLAPVTILGLILSRVLPRNDNFYHNNVVVVQKPTDGPDRCPS